MKNNSKNKTRKKNIAKLLSIVLTTLLLIVLLISKYNDAQTSKNQEIKYSEIINYIDVKAISTYINSNKIFVTFTDQTKKFAYILSSNEFWEYVNQQQLLGNNIEISVDGNSSSGTLGTTFSLISSILMIG